MITARARTFIVAAGVLYLFANQTQVGWLYVMSALLAGAALACGWLSRGMLQHIDTERKVGTNPDVELFEGELIGVELTTRQMGRSAALQVRLTETCPLAAPDDPRRNTVMFIPSLPGGEAVQFDYDVTLDRRGLHEFPPLKLESRAPFGLFAQRRELSTPTQVLVYPEVRQLRRLDLLDRQLAPQMSRNRAGTGYEVMGVRPFRSGDSPRQIHWRSVARTGQMISKEYADEAQPGVTLALDLYQHPYTSEPSKHTPFEWAVKCAASIGEFSRLKGYPLHLLTDDDVLAAPVGPLSRFALLQYLARIQPSGITPFSAVLARPVQAFVAAIITWPDRGVVAPLMDLHRRRIEVLAVVIDPATFPAGEGIPSAAPLADELRAARIETRYVQFDREQDNDWASQLSEQPMYASNSR